MSLAQIIPKKLIAVESNWQKELASAFTEPGALLSFLGFDPKKYIKHIEARKLFPMRVRKRQFSRPFIDASFSITR
jgi:L-lysine 2,3-aminomutase